MLNIKIIKRLCIVVLVFFSLVIRQGVGAEFSASFKGVDIQEFINTVSKNLNKTIIIDPAVHGTITVRSYDRLNDEQYYQFFLSVLDVYGFAVVDMKNGVLKVVRAKDAKPRRYLLPAMLNREREMKSWRALCPSIMCLPVIWSRYFVN
ncbi:General secretion pathway protein D [Klebsiella michiganensis]|uniref:General secretion pathway protein D n=1 Tax=Klebsiella michiganensis TaxID=1134687 RepID=A0A7H4LXY4_9ENTR|nr:General secretion pathway protein D [Klebsiella michiganensis]